MKKFAWRLQRLLDIKLKQEDALRGELAALTEKQVSVRGLILEIKTQVRERLEQLGQVEASQRIHEQAFFMRFADTIRQQLDSLDQKLRELETKRQEKIQEILQARKQRMTLEGLRQKAYEEYEEEVKKFEQNQLDDRNCVRYARMALSENISEDLKTAYKTW